MRDNFDKFKKELKEFVEEDLGDKKAICFIYGSYSYGLEKEHSDIDLVVIKRNTTKQIIEKVSEKVLELHKKYGLSLDNEVPHRVKTIISNADVMMALDGKGFESDGERIIIPKVEKNKKFLSSEKIKRRLILNALTSKGIFVCGDKKLYALFKEEALKTLIKVIILNKGIKEFSLKEFIDLLIPSRYSNQELYLGYKDEDIIRDHLSSTIRKTLEKLTEEKIFLIDNGRFKLNKESWANGIL
ncbi:hypothetical protein CMI41_03560 [Candidatus Pacearchaeota archaeon]|nr:hypothetical protein [Candidatus Pacearchaeota archaeon]|tara:strand:- start:8035 stop:8763 length:729 start_codon:yes stop_codon:yes gene_type:complete